ncbi:endochitinase 4-like [Cryptomeria japonica]|uniref:endochitinase 4-like n=1 Tax=Cryptomeria japonica TaxID=3369 RepID=UPI0027DA09AC|nr:endochitinase 4-like [Cryptomeria japonica]
MAKCANIVVLVMATLILVGEMHFISAQKCGCPEQECCSKWGYCGTTQSYCGVGCQQGPCTVPSGSSPTPFGSIEYTITKAFFDRIKAGIPASCKGKNFYTYEGFISAARARMFSGFGTTGSLTVQKRELAAFFANVAHETGSMCYIEEIVKRTYCQPSTQYPCAPGKQYYGRGPLQLTWNYNYGAAGQFLGLPLLRNPDLVAQKSDVAFKTSLWFWMRNSNCHRAMTSPGGSGFAGTIRAINGGECGGGNPAAVNNRVNLYKKFCGWLQVTTGSNLSC